MPINHGSCPDSGKMPYPHPKENSCWVKLICSLMYKTERAYLSQLQKLLECYSTTAIKAEVNGAEIHEVIHFIEQVF